MRGCGVVLGRLNVDGLVLASVLAGLCGVFELVPGPPFDVPFPLYSRVSWDLTGLPMMVSLFFAGPVGAVYTCVVGCSFIFLRGNIYGGIFKLIAELVTILGFVVLRRGFLVRLVGAVFCRVLVMSLVSYFFLPVFYGLSMSFVVGVLPFLALMNASQALINIVPAKVIYSRLGDAWRSRLHAG